VWSVLRSWRRLNVTASIAPKDVRIGITDKRPNDTDNELTIKKLGLLLPIVFKTFDLSGATHYTASISG